MREPSPRAAGFVLCALLLVSALSAGLIKSRAGAASATIGVIQHVVIIMQENRSFDSYVGTFPGADGIPMERGRPSVCVPDPKTHRCVRPFHDRFDANLGGPHGWAGSVQDIAGGRMTGFIRSEPAYLSTCKTYHWQVCSMRNEPPDVMGYQTAADLPNYWAYARKPARSSQTRSWIELRSAASESRRRSDG